MRTRLHSAPICEACLEDDHAECVEEIAGVLCSCVDSYHFTDHEEAEW